MKNFRLIFKGLYFGRILLDEKESYDFHESIIDWIGEKDSYMIEVIHCDFLESGKTFYEFIGYEPFLPLINEDFAGLIISLKAQNIKQVESWVKRLSIIKNHNMYVELRVVSELIKTNLLIIK